MSQDREDAARREEALRSTARPATSSPTIHYQEDEIGYPLSVDLETPPWLAQSHGPSASISLILTGVPAENYQVVASTHPAYGMIQSVRAQTQLQLQIWAQAQAQVVRNATRMGATFGQQQQQTPPVSDLV
jgi:hypothetical protein